MAKVQVLVARQPSLYGDLTDGGKFPGVPNRPLPLRIQLEPSLHCVKGGEADDECNGPLDPVHCGALVEPAHALIFHEESRGRDHGGWLVMAVVRIIVSAIYCAPVNDLGVSANGRRGAA